VPPFTSYVPKILPLGDSITHGVEDDIHAGWRWTFWNLIGGANVNFVGSQIWGGEDHGLDSDPEHEGHNGYWVREGGTSGSITVVGEGAIPIYAPDMVIVLGGTNDIGGGDNAATVAASISAMLDRLWAVRATPWMQIGVCEILQRQDAFDSIVQAVNAMLPGIIAGKSYADHLGLIPAYASAGGAGGMFDAVHPNTPGHIGVGTAIYNGAVPILARIVRAA